MAASTIERSKGCSLALDARDALLKVNVMAYVPEQTYCQDVEGTDAANVTVNEDAD